MDYTIFDNTDTAEGQLDTGIGASDLSIPLKTGEGAEFPVVVNGSATSLGSETVLNATGIGATGVLVGDFIENLTDGSRAFVLAVNTDSLTTTPLRGGSDNLWQNSDEYAANRFVATLNKRDADGNITQSEKVIIKARANGADILTVTTGGRGYDGSSPAAFDGDDYVSLFVVSAMPDNFRKALADAFDNISEKADLTYVNAALVNRNWKAAVVAGTTTNVTLASDLENGDTLDGITLTTGDRILVKDQSTASENGIYTVNASGAPTRATDFDEDAEATSAVVAIERGDENGDTVWFCSDDTPEIGVDDITFIGFGETITTTNQMRKELGGTVSVRDAVKFDSNGKVVSVDEDTFSGVVLSSVIPSYSGTVSNRVMGIDTARNIIFVAYSESASGSDTMGVAVQVFENGAAKYGAAVDINTSEQIPEDIAWNPASGEFLIVSIGGTDDVGAVAVTVNTKTLAITAGSAVAVKSGSGGSPRATVTYDPVQLAYLVVSVTNTATEYRVLTVSGTTITQGTAASFVTSGTTSELISAYHSPSAKVIVFYRNGTTNRLVVAATVDGAARTATFGSTVTVSSTGSGAGDNAIVYDPVSEQMLLIYETTNVLGRLCSISGSTITLEGSETTLITGSSSVSRGLRNMATYSDFHKAVFVSAWSSGKMARVVISSTSLIPSEFTVLDAGAILALADSEHFFVEESSTSAFVMKFRALDVANAIGLAAESGSSGEYKRINLFGAIATGFSGLTAGEKYIIGGYELGRATDTTDVFLTKTP